MLIYGALLKCVSPVVAIAALLSERTPFLSPLEAREAAAEAQRRFHVPTSDHLTMLRAYEAWHEQRQASRGAAIEFCKQHFLAWRTMETVHGLVSQYLEALTEIDFLAPANRHRRDGRWGRADYESVSDEDNVNSNNQAVVTAVICAGLYPNVIRVEAPRENYVQTAHGVVAVDREAKEFRFYLREENRRVFLHPSSVNFRQNRFPSPFLVYLQMMETQKLYVYDTTMVLPYSLLLFGGALSADHQKGIVSVSDWIKLRAPPRIAALVKALRREADRLLWQKVEDPSIDIFSSPVIEALLRLLTGSGFS
jgi:ATP-dependent RNA helicase DHX57